MKFTLSWLKEHLETDADVDAIGEALTRIGLEVEAIENKAALLAPFTVAYVKSAARHPNADKLQVCEVETAGGVTQVVCGAPNARAGMKGVFAPSGSIIPGSGLVLKPTQIRGVESNGMLCSEREMGLSGEHDGIIELPDDAPVGAPIAQVMGLDDPVILIKLTPNRGDCAGVHGIARDLAAAGLGTLKTPPVPPVEGRFASPITTALHLAAETADACPLFAGRLIKGVTNRPSPAWLQRRLKAVGLRPISALVDVTNLLSLDRARPLHVFDADKISGNLQARMAHANESIVGLDGETYRLSPEICVIADDTRALGIAGVMGGLDTGCTEETKNVFIEAALFSPQRIAQAGRMLNITSDARFRFERGVDPEFCLPGLELASALILQFCGGEASTIVTAGAAPEWRRTIAFDAGRVAALTGLSIDDETIVQILNDLGFGVAGRDAALVVTPPSWRPDIEGSADLVEEVVRIAGLDRLPSTPLPRLPGVARAVLTPLQRRVRDTRRLLAARGLTETINNSFVPRAHAQLFGGGDDERQLANPMSAEIDAMRPSLLPSLLAAAARNADRGASAFSAFEIGPQFLGGTPGEQVVVAAGLRSGAPERHWQGARPADLFAVKADVAEVLTLAGLNAASLAVTREAPAWYHPGRSGAIKLGPKILLATFGEAHPRVARAFDLDGPVQMFEVFLDALPQPKAKPTKAKPPLKTSDYPAVERDFAFLVDSDISAAQIIRAAQGAEKTLIERVSVFDVYAGKGVPEGRKSVAIAVRLQPFDRTLTEPEIEKISSAIVSAVTKATGGALRAG
ncbi:MAG: phenylalanine--tRNA ligase subunit beta [Alphaproteobacteria bacterium]|nr:phenylalanine--tRNA ligase subunit beta [Alphaproteobacteria bacterium]